MDLLKVLFTLRDYTLSNECSRARKGRQSPLSAAKTRLIACWKRANNVSEAEKSSPINNHVNTTRAAELNAKKPKATVPEIFVEPLRGGCVIKSHAAKSTKANKKTFFWQTSRINDISDFIFACSIFMTIARCWPINHTLIIHNQGIVNKRRGPLNFDFRFHWLPGRDDKAFFPSYRSNETPNALRLPF